ncbi:MAG: ABC-F family ATP-binding cassette domain-containing protein, partial [Phycisphaerales bacterium]|nr:ABC-F family ATP-binding cassette domain-containing protein [Phycisphaerales bacterium]
GPNGAGKTTLVRTLLGEIAPDSGASRLGSNVLTGHYRQTHEGIDPEATVWRQLQRIILKENPGGALSEQAARNLAGAFLFSGDEQEKTLGVLSGGERARVVLAGLLASAKNLLILDEPTNHLDIPSAERLEEALGSGDEDLTVIIISHDRAFIDATCDHLIVLDGQGGATAFFGNYSEWREKEQARSKEAAAEESRKREERERLERQKRAAEEQRKQSERAAAPKPAKLSPLQAALARMSMEQLEEKIASAEKRLREIDASLTDPAVWRDQGKSQRLGDERARLVSELEPLEFEWSRRAESM